MIANLKVFSIPQQKIQLSSCGQWYDRLEIKKVLNPNPVWFTDSFCGLRQAIITLYSSPSLPKEYTKHHDYAEENLRR